MKLVAQESAPISPHAKARLAGLLYLLITIAAPFGDMFVRGKLVAHNDAANPAANIANEPLYRFGGVADLVAFAADVALTGLGLVRGLATGWLPILGFEVTLGVLLLSKGVAAPAVASSKQLNPL